MRQNDKRLRTYTQNLTLEFQYKNVCCVVLVFALERIQIREQPKAASSLGAFSCCLCYVSVAETLQVILKVCCVCVCIHVTMPLCKQNYH